MGEQNTAADRLRVDPETILQAQTHAMPDVFGTARACQNDVTNAFHGGAQSRSKRRYLLRGANPADRLLENFTYGVEVAASKLFVFRRGQQPRHLRLVVA